MTKDETTDKRSTAATRWAEWRELKRRADQAKKQGNMAYAQFVRVERAKLGLKKYDKRRKFARV